MKVQTFEEDDFIKKLASRVPFKQRDIVYIPFEKTGDFTDEQALDAFQKLSEGKVPFDYTMDLASTLKYLINSTFNVNTSDAVEITDLKAIALIGISKEYKHIVLMNRLKTFFSIVSNKNQSEYDKDKKLSNIYLPFEVFHVSKETFNQENIIDEDGKIEGAKRTISLTNVIYNKELDKIRYI